MKPALFAFVSLVLGVAIGWMGTRAEFAADVLPRLPIANGAANGTGGASSGPRAEVVNGERHNFGQMNRLGKGTHAFQIKNAGDGPLEISLGQTTCKCTLGTLAKNKLQPGETTDVLLEWTARTGESQFEQSAEINTNDPQHNPVRLVIHGKVIDTVKPEETAITLNDISTNEVTSARLRVFAYDVNDLAVTRHEWVKPDNADRLQVSFEPLSAEEVAAGGAKSGVAVLLRVQPGLPLGPLNEVLKVKFNIADQEALEIPLFGTVISDVSIAGPSVIANRLLVNLGTIKAGSPFKRTVFVTVKGPFREQTGLQLVGVTPEDELRATLGAALRDNPRLDRYPLTIELSPMTRPVARTADENFGHIDIQLTHPQVKQLNIKVRYIVKE
ncbi:MAG: DUF1573 domain-containing protein [Planctomycetaceae bacterium]|nr:DUF1573 domain-containing protein [Planctomycetaceae bacterium]